MRASLGVLVFLASAALPAQSVNIPVTNWTVPPYNHSSGGLTTMTDFTPPRVFVAVVPCRVVDTRNAPGPYGGPALATNAIRAFDIDNGPCPGIPAGVDAYSLNFGGILPPADGFLTAWPTGSGQPVVSQLNLVGGEVVANAAIVPAGTGGSINVLVNTGPTNIYVDINGYFSDMLGNPANFLELYNNSSGFTINAENSSASCVGACGIAAEVSSTAGAWAVEGSASGGSGLNHGVRGTVSSPTSGSAGVFGQAVGGGLTYGVHGSANVFAGVFGEGGEYGVLGKITSDAGADSAGVRGFAGSVGLSGGIVEAGVRGEASATGGSIGVLGISTYLGVGGYLVDLFGNELAVGRLGYFGSYGVFSGGDYGGTGAKYFVEPHPSDASKVIRYIALEGPEPGTYFRGRGRFERGIARIAVPEDFRMVTDEEGLTVQITPIGPMATVSVLKADLDQIIVQASRNVEFYYLVQGIRRTHKHLTSPIGEGTEYAPSSAHATMPHYLTEGQKRFLVQNGTYKPDGTVNIETARRLGWDHFWAEQGRPSPQPMP